MCDACLKPNSGNFARTWKTHNLRTIYLDGVIEFVASESSHVEKDFSQGISHSRFGTLQTFDKGFVALARRPRQIRCHKKEGGSFSQTSKEIKV